MRIESYRPSRRGSGHILVTVGVLLAGEASALAQTATSTGGRSRGGAAAATETIKITGTKRAGGELAEDAPVAVTAVGEEQMEALQFRDVESLTFSIPNVSLDSVGTTKGVANFSIRGLGANSSIPSIDPTVGLFVNGVYFGSNAGAVLDSFDLEAVEVLRGPQGVLFGRNVTGGAVLFRTKRPGDTYSATAIYGMESPFQGEGGFEFVGSGAVDLPIVPDLLKIRLAGQYRSDTGWFTNQFPVGFDPGTMSVITEDRQFGFEDTYLLRPTVTLTPVKELTVHIMYERGRTDASGPAAQSAAEAGFNDDIEGADARGRFEGFEFSIDEPGFAIYEWNHIFTETTLDMGDAGRLVHIFGYRTVDSTAVSDIDSQPVSLFHASVGLDIDHFSNELRYTGSWFDDFLEPTFGLYQFSQTMRYREGRLLFEDAPTLSPTGAAIDSTFGGDQDQLSLGAFAQLVFKLTDNFSATLGGRYTYERKEVDIANFSPAGGPCPAATDTLECDALDDFNDDQDWSNFSPKVGLSWEFVEDSLLYTHWTQGFRSGGYNLRNTDPTIEPGPFNEEQLNATELGYKGSLFDRKLRFGLAGFYTRIDDIQREVNQPGAAGVVQVIQNTADANVYGFEAEATFVPISSLVFTGSLGLVDATYDNLQFDINDFGAVEIPGLGEDLLLPRLTRITSNLGGLYDLDLGDSGIITFRANWAYRDSSFFTDNNFGILPGGHVVDASVSYTFADVDLGSSYLLPRITLYGRNLANTKFLGGQTPVFGQNFSPLKEGRVLGLRLRVDWE